MSDKKITKIPAYIYEKLKKYRSVGVYCRVSTKDPEQLHSLASQISHYVKMYRDLNAFRIYDIYIDIMSGSKAEERSEYQRMLDDCRNKKLDIVITKSISRLGRDTVEVLNTIRLFQSCGVELIFEQEGVNTKNTDGELLISLLAGYAQAENESRSDNIRWGIHKRAADGTSGLYRRRCYGYISSDEKRLEIVPEEADVVRFIFNEYLNGASTVKIQSMLKERGILSPSRRTEWCKRTIDQILCNEKYCGRVILIKTVRLSETNAKRVSNDGQEKSYMSVDNHPPIISVEDFDRVQEEKHRRSNVESTENGKTRRKTRYTCCQDKADLPIHDMD